ncbi:MAG TPA: hypothetical protein VGI10_05490 [Polyangiaceae bacterium]|jgi:hypothetical protein
MRYAQALAVLLWSIGAFSVFACSGDQSEPPAIPSPTGSGVMGGGTPTPGSGATAGDTGVAGTSGQDSGIAGDSSSFGGTGFGGTGVGGTSPFGVGGDTGVGGFSVGATGGTF